MEPVVKSEVVFLAQLLEVILPTSQAIVSSRVEIVNCEVTLQVMVATWVDKGKWKTGLRKQHTSFLFEFLTFLHKPHSHLFRCVLQSIERVLLIFILEYHKSSSFNLFLDDFDYFESASVVEPSKLLLNRESDYFQFREREWL